MSAGEVSAGDRSAGDRSADGGEAAANAIRLYYEEQIGRAAEDGRELYAYFDPSGLGGSLWPDNDWQQMPLGVLEAYAFYNLYVQEQDWGSVGAYRVDADGTPTVAVWTSDDGGTCWLEVYGAAEPGPLLAAGRSANGRVAWMPRNEIRRHVFETVILPEALLTPEQAEYYRSHGLLP